MRRPSASSRVIFAAIRSNWTSRSLARQPSAALSGDQQDRRLAAAAHGRRARRALAPFLFQGIRQDVVRAAYYGFILRHRLVAPINDVAAVECVRRPRSATDRAARSRYCIAGALELDQLSTCMPNNLDLSALIESEANFILFAAPSRSDASFNYFNRFFQRARRNSASIDMRKPLHRDRRALLAHQPRH